MCKMACTKTSKLVARNTLFHYLGHPSTTKIQIMETVTERVAVLYTIQHTIQHTYCVQFNRFIKNPCNRAIYFSTVLVLSVLCMMNFLIFPKPCKLNFWLPSLQTWRHCCYHKVLAWSFLHIERDSYSLKLLLI